MQGVTVLPSRQPNIMHTIIMLLSIMRGNTYLDTSTMGQHGYRQVSERLNEADCVALYHTSTYILMYG